jgi:FSR family fosmidomycin resistance protein-like MFS transporter
MWGVWPLFKTLQGIDLAWAGLVGGVGAFFAEISQVFFGGWSDRGGRFLLIALGILLAMAIPTLPLASGILGYLLIYLTFAIGSAAFHPAAAGGIASLFPQARGTTLALFWASGGLGLALSQLTFAKIYTSFNEGTIVLSLIGLPLVILAFFLHRQKVSSGISTQKKPFSFTQIFQFFRRRDTRLLWLFHFSITSIYWGTIFYFPDILKEKACPSWICDGTGHLFFVLGAAFMSLPAGWIADRFSPRSVLQVTVLVSMVAYFILLLSPDLPAYILLPLAMGVGAGLGVVTPLTIAWGNAMVPESPGLISAFLMGFVWFVSELVGITGVGLLSRLFDEAGATQSLVVLGLLFVLASFSLYRLGKAEETVIA